MTNSPRDPIVLTDQRQDQIACDLTIDDLADRGVAWRKVCEHATASEDVPGGVSIRFGPLAGISDSVRELAHLEADCCPWMEFVIDDEPGAGTTLVVRANSEEGVGAIRSLFTRDNLKSPRPPHP